MFFFFFPPKINKIKLLNLLIFTIKTETDNSGAPTIQVSEPDGKPLRRKSTKKHRLHSDDNLTVNILSICFYILVLSYVIYFENKNKKFNFNFFEIVQNSSKR